MKKLIVSGCSFTDKNFESICHPDRDFTWPKWPELLAKKLNMECINLAQSGKGNEFIYSTLLDEILNTNKEDIGLVIAAWSQCHRKDYQVYEYGKWRDHRVDPDGDLLNWVKRSIRYMQSFKILCERFNLPYIHFQMINLYKDFLWGLRPTEKERLEGKTDEKDRLKYPGNDKEDEKNIIKLLLNEKYIDDSKFIGWPIARQLNGFTVSSTTLGLESTQRLSDKLIVSELDDHPNEEGHKKIMEYIHGQLVHRLSIK